MNDAPPPSETNPAAVTLCPYCGQTNQNTDRCVTCGGLFESLSLKATQIAMGPWYIRDKGQPFRPGCSIETLLSMIKAGKIKPTSVLRGPTTQQFWSIARNIPGIAHHVGYCHECSTDVSSEATQCPACGVAFQTPAARDQLGLKYTTAANAKAAQKKLDAQVQAVTQQAKREQSAGPSEEDNTSTPTSADASKDYLTQVFGQTPNFALPEESAAAADAPINVPSVPDTPRAPTPPAPAPRQPMPAPPPRQGTSPWLIVIAANVVLLLLALLLLYVLFGQG